MRLRRECSDIAAKHLPSIRPISSRRKFHELKSLSSPDDLSAEDGRCVVQGGNHISSHKLFGLVIEGMHTKIELRLLACLSRAVLNCCRMLVIVGVAVMALCRSPFHKALARDAASSIAIFAPWPPFGAI